MQVVSKLLFCFLFKHFVKPQVAFQMSLYRNKLWSWSSMILFRPCKNILGIDIRNMCWAQSFSWGAWSRRSSWYGLWPDSTLTALTFFSFSITLTSEDLQIHLRKCGCKLPSVRLFCQKASKCPCTYMIQETISMIECAPCCGNDFKPLPGMLVLFSALQTTAHGDTCEKRVKKIYKSKSLQWFIKAMKYWNAPSPSLSIFSGRQPCSPCRSLLLGRSSSSLARGAGGSKKPVPGGCCVLPVRRAGVAPRSSPHWGTRGSGICLILWGCGPYSLAAVGGVESWAGVTEDNAAALMHS